MKHNIKVSLIMIAMLVISLALSFVMIHPASAFGGSGMGGGGSGASGGGGSGDVIGPSDSTPTKIPVWDVAEKTLANGSFTDDGSGNLGRTVETTDNNGLNTTITAGQAGPATTDGLDGGHVYLNGGVSTAAAGGSGGEGGLGGNIFLRPGPGAAGDGAGAAGTDGIVVLEGVARFSNRAGTGAGTLTTVLNQNLDIAPAGTGVIKLNGTTVTAAGISMATAANAAAQTALLSNFTGDAGAGGAKGLVPAPAAGDAVKYLRGNGTWATVSGGVASDADGNTLSGTGAGASLTAGAGVWNSFFGKDAGAAVTTGDTNVCIGYESGKTTTNTSNNVYVGYSAGEFATGQSNTVVGSFAASLAASGSSNVIVGSGACMSITSGEANTIIGTSAGAGLTSGLANTVIGTSATCGSTNNTAISLGFSASTIGDNSMAIGPYASASGVTSIAIGRGASATTNNTCVVGGSGYPINNVYFGNGMTNTAPTSYAVCGTGGSGVDKAGGAIQLSGGKSTGTGYGGNVEILLSSAGTTGSLPNTSTTRVVFAPAAGYSNDTDMAFVSAYGSGIYRATLTEEITLAAAVTTDSTVNLLPANAHILAISARVTGALLNARTWSLGTDTNAGQFAQAGQSGDAGTLTTSWHTGTTSPGGPAAFVLPFGNTTAKKIRVTLSNADGGNGTTTKIRVTVVYEIAAAPTN